MSKSCPDCRAIYLHNTEPCSFCTTVPMFKFVCWKHGGSNVERRKTDDECPPKECLRRQKLCEFCYKYYDASNWSKHKRTCTGVNITSSESVAPQFDESNIPMPSSSSEEFLDVSDLVGFDEPAIMSHEPDIVETVLLLLSGRKFLECLVLCCKQLFEGDVHLMNLLYFFVTECCQRISLDDKRRYVNLLEARSHSAYGEALLCARLEQEIEGYLEKSRATLDDFAKAAALSELPLVQRNALYNHLMGRSFEMSKLSQEKEKGTFSGRKCLTLIAAHYYRKAAESRTGFFWPLRNLSLMMIDSKESDDALSMLSGAVKIFPLHGLMKSRSVGLSSDDMRFKLELADFYAAAAWYYLMQGEFSKFDTFFNQAAVMNSDYTEFVKSDLLLGRFQKFQAAEYYIRGLSKERINCDAEALDAYRYIIIALDDNYVPAWMRLEYLYRKFGMKQDAEKAAHKVKLLTPMP